MTTRRTRFNRDTALHYIVTAAAAIVVAAAAFALFN